MNILIPVNRKRFPHILIISLLFVLLIGKLLWHEPPFEIIRGPANFAIFLIGFIVMIGYSIIAFVLFAYTILNKSASLIVTDEGINDTLSLLSCGKIAWHEIRAVEKISIAQFEGIHVILKDPAAIIARQPGWKRLLLKRMTKQSRTPVLILARNIQYDLQKLKSIFLEKII